MEIEKQKIPKHIAIITDGNRRWAKENNMPDFHGHEEGAKRTHDIVLFCSRLGIQYLSLYAFSMENFKRSLVEINILMKIINNNLKKLKKEAIENNVKIQVIGHRTLLPQYLQQTISMSENQTKDCTGMILTIALAYSGRVEITDTFKKMIELVEQGKIKREEITPEMIGQHLYTANIPDPDLLIRTGREKRISNFMNWQISYTELYYTDTHWPDFNEQLLLEAIQDYTNRKRKYGGN